MAISYAYADRRCLSPTRISEAGQSLLSRPGLCLPMPISYAHLPRISSYLCLRRAQYWRGGISYAGDSTESRTGYQVLFVGEALVAYCPTHLATSSYGAGWYEAIDQVLGPTISPYAPVATLLRAFCYPPTQFSDAPCDIILRHRGHRFGAGPTLSPYALFSILLRYPPMHSTIRHHAAPHPMLYSSLSL
eukprot:1605242-Rhodomonas_salina.1